MRPVEELDELAIPHRTLLVVQAHGLGVLRAPAAYLPVRWVRGVAAGVPDLDLPLRQVPVVLVEYVLGAPEAARGERCGVD